MYRDQAILRADLSSEKEVSGSTAEEYVGGGGLVAYLVSVLRAELLY
jgi:hypothetical protein